MQEAPKSHSPVPASSASTGSGSQSLPTSPQESTVALQTVQAFSLKSQVHPVSRRFVLWTVLVLGLLTRLVALQVPASVIFDEVYFGKFSTAYCCNHRHVFDVHPPHAKLMIAAVAKVFGYDGQQDFGRIGLPVAPAKILALRLAPAVVGALIPLAVAVLLLQLGAAPATALLFGLAAALDNALIVQARAVLTDGFLALGHLVTMSFALKGVRSFGRRRIFWLVAAGIAAGFTVGTKFSGIAAPAGALLVLATATRRAKTEWKSLAMDSGVCICVAVLTYVIGWWVHFQLMSQPGPGDAFYKPTGRFWHDLNELHGVMLRSHRQMVKPHDYSSPWWSWPWMRRSVFYWRDRERVIYLIGNLAVWWPAAILTAHSLFDTLMAALLRVSPAIESFKLKPRRHVNALQLGAIELCLLVFAGSYLPFANIERTLFVYAYFPALTLSLVVAGLWAEELGLLPREGVSIRHKVAIASLVVGFLVLAPLSYGWNFGGYPDWVFLLFPSWR